MLPNSTFIFLQERLVQIFRLFQKCYINSLFNAVYCFITIHSIQFCLENTLLTQINEKNTKLFVEQNRRIFQQMKLHGYFWFQFEMSETSGFTPLQCWRGNLVCGAENKEKLHSEIATETFQTNFHSPCIWVCNETKYINVSIVTYTRLEYIHVIPISTWTQFRGRYFTSHCTTFI